VNSEIDNGVCMECEAIVDNEAYERNKYGGAIVKKIKFVEKGTFGPEPNEERNILTDRRLAESMRGLKSDSGGEEAADRGHSKDSSGKEVVPQEQLLVGRHEKQELSLPEGPLRTQAPSYIEDDNLCVCSNRISEGTGICPQCKTIADKELKDPFRNYYSGTERHTEVNTHVNSEVANAGGEKEAFAAGICSNQSCRSTLINDGVCIRCGTIVDMLAFIASDRIPHEPYGYVQKDDEQCHGEDREFADGRNNSQSDKPDKEESPDHDSVDDERYHDEDQEFTDSGDDL
jgi:hypothetical protein